MSRIEFYVEALSKTKDWKSYLLANSNLPFYRIYFINCSPHITVHYVQDFFIIINIA
jgi:hypothetical protein